MKRIIEAELETRAKKATTAINRFFKKYPELDYWKEHIEYMAENGDSFSCDNMMANGEKNNDWCYAIHFDANDDWYYICIIERA